jgi:iron complex outermembrane recepter protein
MCREKRAGRRLPLKKRAPLVSALVVAGLSINGGLYYIGPRAVNDLDQASIGGYTLLTAGLRYTTRIFGKRATIQANFENATNKRYWSAAGSNQIGVGLGRTLELSSTFDF